MTLGFALVSLMFTDAIIRIILGKDFAGAVLPFQILSFLPFIAALGEMTGTYWLLAQFRDSSLTNMVLGITALHVVLMLALGSTFGAAGAASAVIISQTFALAWTIVAIRRPHHPAYTAE